MGFGRPVASTLSFPDSPSCKGGKSGKSSFEHITESLQRQSAGHYPVPASQGLMQADRRKGRHPLPSYNLEEPRKEVIGEIRIELRQGSFNTFGVAVEPASRPIMRFQILLERMRAPHGASLLSILLLAGPSGALGEKVDFAREVLPILSLSLIHI